MGLAGSNAPSVAGEGGGMEMARARQHVNGGDPCFDDDWFFNFLLSLWMLLLLRWVR